MLAVLGRADLHRIGGRHRIDPICIQQGRRHRVVPLHIPGTPGNAIKLPAPRSLILEIVDCENGADLRVLVHPHRQHPGVPVVAVQHLRFPVMPAEFRSRAGKESEAPILVFTAVDALWIENWMAY